MSDWGLDSEMVDCMSCGTVSSLDEVSDRGGRCPVCGQYNHDLDAGRHHTASRKLHTAADEDYRDSHQAPGPEDGAPMHDVTQGIYPASFYDEPFRYWGTDESTGDRDSWGTIHKVRGNPDARVKVHRALPLDVAKRERGIGLAAPLNTGDWVTPSYNYAHEHGMSRLEGNTPWTVVTSTVPASQLHTDGNSLAEWGYNGPPTQGYEGANAAGKRKYRQQQVRKQQINAETTKDFHHCGFCGSPSGEPCERGCWGKKKYPGERDVRGDLPGQPGVSGGGEIDYDPGALRDIRLSHRSADGIRYAQVVEADVADDLARMRLAAVNQDLVDKLHNEFHQWAVDYAGPSEDLYGDQHNRGPIGEWKNVESFLHDRYPAAHKNHDYGQEEAAWALDGHEPMPYQLENQGKEYGSDLTPYATGPEAVAQHGYDPAEIAASMVLLHNQSHPLRGNLAQEDQDRLTDIFQKRQKMQRDYEQRTKTAMPWYHRTDDELNPGDHLLPYNQVHPDHQEVGDESWNPNKAYVYYGEEDDSSDHAPYAGYGQHIYEIEPHDDPQRDYGDGNHSSHMTDGGTVIKRLPDEDPYSFGEEPQWADPIAHKYASRTAMPAPLPKGTYFRYHPELVWSPGVTAHAPGGKQVGSLEWYDDDHVMVDLGTRRPGEIDRIQVPEDHRGQSIATSMFDFAKQHEPRLHHSDILTEDGRGWSAYEQSRHDHARLASSEWPDPSRETIPADPQYVYHGTHDYNAQDIADFGHLDVHDPDYGTDQDTWPDGSVELRSYWTHDPQVARNFYPEGGRPTLLRSPRSSGDFRQERHSGDLYSTSPISADHLEVYSGPGQWTPLTQHREQRTAGKNGPPPPMTFEPFNTMWTNGIMARHARQVTAANWRTSLGDGLDSDELLTLYHRTTRSNAHQIMQTQGWTPNPERGDYDAPIDAPRTDQHIYFALRPGGDKSYGPSVVSTQVPRGKVKRDETQFWNGGPNDPQWVRVHVDDLAGRPIRRERPR